MYGTLRNDFMCNLLDVLGDGFYHFESLIGHLLCLVVSCARVSFALCFILLITYLTFVSYRKLGFMTKISAFHKLSVWGTGGCWG